MIYLDSSALVKRYLEEDGTDVIQSLLRETEVFATSKLTYPEILSAFRKKHRVGEMKRKTLEAVTDKFENDWEKIFVIEFHNELLQGVKKLIEKYPLRGADALHLASALWLDDTLKMGLTFVASDIGLLNAARSEALKILNPQR